MENSVNERIKTLRKGLNLSQQKFAERIGVKNLTISRIENFAYAPSNETILKIVETLNVNHDWLVNGVGEMFAEGGVKVESKVSGWRDEAYTKLEQYNESLKAEVAFLKNIVSGLLPVQKSFKNGTGASGILMKNLPSSVRASA